VTRTLILVRHGQSEFNAQNLFTGWRDVSLNAKGIAEGDRIGAALARRRLTPDVIFTSALQRTVQTGLLINAATGGAAQLVHAVALNERDYGELTGLNKDEARAQFGADQVQRWRRSFREAPPGGESLRDTVARVLPYFLRCVLPKILESGVVVLVGHGNTLRALTFGLEEISEADIAKLEFQTGEGVVYIFGPTATVVEKAALRA
jgi:2,3-bisphosphoglycerate-dependent phosphoglycerate mutase